MSEGYLYKKKKKKSHQIVWFQTIFEIEYITRDYLQKINQISKPEKVHLDIMV